MPFSVVIPARFGSTRLPGKPLEDIAGQPMVQRVWAQASKSGAERVIIATDDEGIAAAARGFGAQVCLTDPDHPSGTDRLQEVAAQLGLEGDAVLVNVQGDEPLIPPAVIDQVAANLMTHSAAAVATLCEPIDAIDALVNPNIVKVVRDAEGMALYFSRAPVPWPREAFARTRTEMPQGQHWYRHIGIYAYRAGFLHRFVQWAPAPLELTEQLEQLRAMHHGVQIHVAPACAEVPGGVDTPEDLARVRAQFEGGES